MLKRKRSAKRNERIDDLTSSKKNKRTCLTTSSKKNKRTCLTRSSAKNRKNCYGGETSDLHLESNQGASIELREDVASNLSKSVVSLALSNGHMVLFTCSGIAVERKGVVSRFLILTSASLVKALNDKRKDHDNLKIEVRHGDNVFIGFLGEYDLDQNIAVVNVKKFPSIEAIALNIRNEFPPHSNVVAVARDISGKLITTSGILICRLGGPLQSLVTTTCKISKVYEGGPLVDLDGNFLGMNLSFSTEGTSFMPEIILFLYLWSLFTSPEEIYFPMQVSAAESSNGEVPYSHQEVYRDVLNEDQFGDLVSLGYPEPPKSMLNDGIILANNFEETFGDRCGRGVWNELRGAVVSYIQDNIVALASFNGGKRFFACTGCLIEWNGCTTILTAASLIRDSHIRNKIVENLRVGASSYHVIPALLMTAKVRQLSFALLQIKVMLPNKELAEGILLHYNLHYNIALVSVNDICASQPVKIQRRWRSNQELLAVGRIFKSGELMAARGLPLSMVNTLDCRFLEFTACEITKAGIGGPLFDFEGKFVGMNFYDKYAKGTPFLPWDVILKVLEGFKTKRTVADSGHDGYACCLVDWTIVGDQSFCVNSWSVPLPFWSRPDDLIRHDNAIRIRRPQFIEI